MEPQAKKKLLAVSLAILAVLAGVFLLASRHANEVRVEIIPIPSDATLTIDGVQSASGSIWLTKGKHTLKATRQFFGPATKTIDTDALDPDEPIYLPLDANTAEALQFIATHPKEQSLAQQAGGAAFMATQKKVATAYPVVTELPYETPTYEINYSVDENKNVSFRVALHATATVPGTAEYNQELLQFKAAALAYLKQKKVDVTKIKITFSPDPEQQSTTP
ncbi:MAG TPA: hypothetical protein VIS56_00560 [Candidatus Saccharimonadales bacterium]